MRKKELFFALSPKRWLLRVLHGILVGSGAILPGVSGGVLCVSFGLYQPMMAFFAHPIQNFTAVFPQLFPAGLGWLAGFFGFARLLTRLFTANADLAAWLFIGLIAGTVPGLFQRAGRGGRDRAGWLALALSFGGMMALFWMLSSLPGLHLRPDVWGFGFCGVMWGLSMVIPGITASAMLIFLDLFEPMTAGIASLRPDVLVPMFLGLALTVALMARWVNAMFHRHESAAAHAALGFVLASTLAIVPTAYGGVRELLCSLLCGLGGFLFAFLLDRREHRHGAE